MNTSIKIFVILLITAPIFAPHSRGEVNSSTDEYVGFGSGALIGASVGGPVGAIVGASIGAFIGDSKANKAQLEADLDETRLEHQNLLDDADAQQARLQVIQRQLVMAEHEIEALHGEIQELFIERALVKGLEFDVYFATDEAEFGEQEMQKLVSLSKLLQQAPQLTVELVGHADVRGPNAYNQTLSLDRAYAVADTLNALGVAQKQLRTFALGESRASANELEQFQQDRRVSLKLGIDESFEPEPNSIDNSTKEQVAKNGDEVAKQVLAKRDVKQTND